MRGPGWRASVSRGDRRFLGAGLARWWGCCAANRLADRAGGYRRIAAGLAAVSLPLSVVAAEAAWSGGRSSPGPALAHLVVAIGCGWLGADLLRGGSSLRVDGLPHISSGVLLIGIGLLVLVARSEPAVGFGSPMILAFGLIALIGGFVALMASERHRDRLLAVVGRWAVVGGAVVVGENDPRALGRGQLRNSVLQVRYVSADGRIVSGGGPTVKNVSGFDLPRLLVGSLGTLGLLAEVILRTNPIPATSRWSSAPDADPMLVHDRLLNPSAILWDGSTTWVELEGHEADVEAQEAVLSELGTFTPAPVGEGGAASGSGLPVDLPPNRWSLAPAALAELDDTETGSFVAAVGLGLVFAERPQPHRPLPAPAAEVARRLKANFDPTGRLNPGRAPDQP